MFEWMMRIVIAIFGFSLGCLLVFALVNSAEAAEISCYAKGSLVYKGKPLFIEKNDLFLLASYKTHDDVIFIQDCIIRGLPQANIKS